MYAAPRRGWSQVVFPENTGGHNLELRGWLSPAKNGKNSKHPLPDFLFIYAVQWIVQVLNHDLIIQWLRVPYLLLSPTGNRHLLKFPGMLFRVWDCSAVFSTE